jgi:hypothetical protein
MTSLTDIVERLIKTANAGRREDGTDIPLTAEIREAASEITSLRYEIDAAREFVKRHPSLSLIDLAEFEAFLKVPGAFLAITENTEGDKP